MSLFCFWIWSYPPHQKKIRSALWVWTPFGFKSKSILCLGREVRLSTEAICEARPCLGSSADSRLPATCWKARVLRLWPRQCVLREAERSRRVQGDVPRKSTHHWLAQEVFHSPLIKKPTAPLQSNFPLTLMLWGSLLEHVPLALEFLHYWREWDRQVTGVCGCGCVCVWVGVCVGG